MTTNDVAPYPMEEPDRLGQLFGAVFDLVDETIQGVTDAEVDERLRELLADGGLSEPGDFDEAGRMLASNGWKVPSLDPVTLARGLTDPAEWDKAQCALQTAWKQVAIAQAAAAVARLEAEAQTAAVAKARRRAAEVTEGVDAYVDESLRRADGILADARQEAARLVAEAKQQAEEIVSAAQARSAPTEVSLADLVRRARLGDQAAWEELVEQFSSLLWWVARRAGLTENDGADAVQTTWLRCFEHLHDIKEPARLPAWLITTCRRESLRIRQIARRFPPTDSLTATSTTAVSSVSSVSRVSPMSPLAAEDDPGVEMVRAAERDAVVREAIASLPERQRKLLSALMDDDSNTSYANVAASLGMPISSIGPTRARALRRLRRDPRVAQLR